MGLTQRDVTSSMLISLSGNNQVAPSFWLNSANGVSYNVGVQTPQYRIDSLDALLRTPVTRGIQRRQRPRRRTRWPGVRQSANASVGVVAERRVAGVRKSRRDDRAARSFSRIWSTSERSYGPVIVNHYNVAPVFDVYANVDRRDLGSVGADVEKIMQEEQAHLPRGTTLDSARPVRDHADVLLPPGPGHDLRGRSGVPADGGELPVLARSVHHPDGAARSAWPEFCGCCSSPAPR